MPTKVALAYSGGLDTSAIIPWLIEQYGCEIVAVVGDVGQGAAELVGIEAKAAASGASECHVVDLRHAFIEEYAWAALITGAVYENRYLLGTALARPIIAKAQVDVALATGCDALAHGCTGKGNDQVRFESAYAALAPHLEVIAPWRVWSMRSREDLLAYLAERSVPCAASATKIYSRDANLWHVSHEGGVLEDPAVVAPDDVWTMTTSPLEAPDEPQMVTIGFVHGRPVTLDGTTLGPDVLVETLNELAGAHGVGREDVVENRVVGMKSRGCYETPAGTVLSAALRGLEELVLDHACLRQRQDLGRTLADILYAGQWFTPATKAVLAAADALAEPMTGTVDVQLYKGAASVIARQSAQSLYAADLATFGADDVYDQTHADGFIRLFSMPGRIAAMRDMSSTKRAPAASIHTQTPAPKTAQPAPAKAGTTPVASEQEVAA